MPQRIPTYLHGLHQHAGALASVTSSDKVMPNHPAKILAGQHLVLEPALPVLFDRQSEAPTAPRPPRLVWHWLAKEQVKMAWAIACQYNVGIHGAELSQIKDGLAMLLAIAATASFPNEDKAIKLQARWYGLRFTMLLDLPDDDDDPDDGWSVKLGVKPDFDLLLTPRSIDASLDTIELIALRSAAKRLNLT